MSRISPTVTPTPCGVSALAVSGVMDRAVSATRPASRAATNFARIFSGNATAVLYIVSSLRKLQWLLRQTKTSGREKHVFHQADLPHAKSASPWCIGGGGPRSSVVETVHGHDVAFAIMGNEISSNVPGHSADCGWPPCRLEAKARTGAEFRNPENSQTSDPPRMNTLLCHDFSPLITLR